MDNTIIHSLIVQGIQAYYPLQQEIASSVVFMLEYHVIEGGGGGCGGNSMIHRLITWYKLAP